MLNCSYPGCERKNNAQGYCTTHYRRLRLYGDAERTNTTPPGVPRQFALSVSRNSNTEDCILWPYNKRKGRGQGYGVFLFERKIVSAHRFVCIDHYGDPPGKGYMAAHSCGVPACVNPKHLRWATPKENTADRVLHGTACKGEQHPRAKLKIEDVRFIRSMEGVKTFHELAAQFKVTDRCIYAIWKRKIWKTV